MHDDTYHKLAKVLDTLPNGFPSTDSGIEIRILKRIFEPDEAELFCDLRLTPETAAQISERTGRPPEGLEQKLAAMWKKGELWAFESEGGWLFKMAPWIVGIYEFQINRMDREFAAMCEEYSRHWGRQFLRHGPQLMQVVPIEREIPVKQEALTYQQVSGIIENAGSYMVHECICKKKQGLLGKPCSKPAEVCLAMAPAPGVFEKNAWGGRVISKEGAYEVLRNAEEAGLVHLTSNVQSGHWFICNCCGCCCGVLQAAAFGLPNVLNSHYYAEIDPALCAACGVCADTRCQVGAISKGDESCSVLTSRCIGCGLCATTCPEGAISMVHKKPEDRIYPPGDENAWLEERARRRGVDFSKYK